MNTNTDTNCEDVNILCPLCLGVYNFCSPIHTGLLALEQGIYYAKLYYNGAYHVLELEISDISELVIPGGLLNEDTEVIMEIITPSGDIYEGFYMTGESTGGYTKFKFKVVLVYELKPNCPKEDKCSDLSEFDCFDTFV